MIESFCLGVIFCFAISHPNIRKIVMNNGGQLHFILMLNWLIHPSNMPTTDWPRIAILIIHALQGIRRRTISEHLISFSLSQESKNTVFEPFVAGDSSTADQRCAPAHDRSWPGAESSGGGRIFPSRRSGEAIGFEAAAAHPPAPADLNAADETRNRLNPDIDRRNTL
jgi:hypothetical protein